jgi:hypothetical protein
VADVPKYILELIPDIRCNGLAGTVVPIPTLPALVTVTFVVPAVSRFKLKLSLVPIVRADPSELPSTSAARPLRLGCKPKYCLALTVGNIALPTLSITETDGIPTDIPFFALNLLFNAIYSVPFPSYKVFT